MIHKYLAYLKTIETGSITRAASELGYTQSAVSRMIADLEEAWNVPLLTRNRSGIEISAEGSQLLPILQSIVKGQEELTFAVGELHGLQSGLIRIGSFTSMATGWMPLMIKSFHEKYPNIRFQILNGEYNQIATWLRRGQIDCGFLALPCSNEFNTTFLLRDALTVILPMDDGLQDRKELRALGADLNARAVAREERNIPRLLQIGDHAADGGLRVAKLTCGAGDAACFYGFKIGEVFVDHTDHLLLYIITITKEE